jgi:hypothetical protein
VPSVQPGGQVVVCAVQQLRLPTHAAKTDSVFEAKKMEKNAKQSAISIFFILFF